MVDLFRYRHWDLVSKRWIYYLISVILLVVGMVAWFAHGLNQGLDFTGGGSVSYRINKHLPEQQGIELGAKLRTALEESIGQTIVTISPSETDDVIIIRTMLPEDAVSHVRQEEMLSAQIEQNINPAVDEVVKAYGAEVKPFRAANAAAGVTEQRFESSELVTGTVSDELKRNATLAVIFGSLLIMGWIWLRYNIGGLGARYAFASIISLAHDMLVLVGLIALFRIEVNSPFIAALLTVLGYSIHDTIVIFDRIRENIRLRKGRTFAEMVNISLLETMARSVNTILTVLITLLALFFFGGPTLRDFIVAMLIGITVGGYSSIFLACQLLVSWAPAKEKELHPAEAAAPLAVAQPAMAVASSAPINAPAAMQSTVALADEEAIKRARAAGKTSKRKR